MNNQKEERLPLPAYISYNTLKGFIKRLKETAVPERVDRSVLRNYSNSVGSQLTSALRYLGLVNDMGITTPQLKALVDAYDTGDYQGALGRCLTESYREVIGDLNLEAATPAQLEERFKVRGPSGDVLRKCVTFFVAAATDAGMSISPHITQRQRAKSTTARGGKRRSSGRMNTESQPQFGAPRGTGIPTDSSTLVFNFPIPGKGAAFLQLPAELDRADWEMISAMVTAFVRRQCQTERVVEAEVQDLKEEE